MKSVICQLMEKLGTIMCFCHSLLLIKIMIVILFFKFDS